MTQTFAQVIIASTISVAVWLVGGGEWPLLIVGAVWALSLWMMLFAGSWAGAGPSGVVATRDYAIGGLIGVALGFVISLVGDGPTWWAVGFILAGILAPTAGASMSGGSDRR